MSHMENPTPNEGRASRVSFGHWTPEALSLSALRAQHLIGAFGIRPELAAMIAALAFSGGAYHG